MMFSLNRLFKLMTSAIFNAGALAFFISGGIFMLISIAVILLCGLLFGGICKRLCFPALIGMIIAGVLIGPYGLNIIDDSILRGGGYITEETDMYLKELESIYEIVPQSLRVVSPPTQDTIRKKWLKHVAEWQSTQ